MQSLDDSKEHICPLIGLYADFTFLSRNGEPNGIVVTCHALPVAFREQYTLCCGEDIAQNDSSSLCGRHNAGRSVVELTAAADCSVFCGSCSLSASHSLKLKSFPFRETMVICFVGGLGRVAGGPGGLSKSTCVRNWGIAVGRERIHHVRRWKDGRWGLKMALDSVQSPSLEAFEALYRGEWQGTECSFDCETGKIMVSAWTVPQVYFCSDCTKGG